MLSWDCSARRKKTQACRPFGTIGLELMLRFWQDMGCGRGGGRTKATFLRDVMIRLAQRTIVLLAMVAAPGSVEAAPPKSVDLFRKQVVPIIQRRCIRCHNRAERKGEFSLQTRQEFEESGFVEAGVPKESHLLDVLLPADGKRAEMPKDGDPLSAADVRVIRDWIKSGATWPNDFEIHPALVTDTDWWSLRPIVRPDVPAAGKSDRKWIRTPIDAFVLSKLREQGLSPSPAR